MGEERIGYATVFKAAWRRYTRHFWTAVLVMFVFLGVSFLINTGFLLSSDAYQALKLGNLTTFQSGPMPPSVNEQPSGLTGNLVGRLTKDPGLNSTNFTAPDPLKDEAMASLGRLMTASAIDQLTNLIASILTVLGTVSLVYLYHRQPAGGVMATVQAASRHYWRAIGVYLLVLLALIALGFGASILGIMSALFPPLLLVVFLGTVAVTIAFGIFWSLAYYILVAEETGPVQALKESFRTVRGRWWRTFGYIALTSIIVFAVALLLALPMGIFAAGWVLVGGTPVSLDLLFVQNFYIAILQAIVVPFMIAFLYSYYLAVRGAAEE